MGLEEVIALWVGAGVSYFLWVRGIFHRCRRDLIAGGVTLSVLCCVVLGFSSSSAAFPQLALPLIGLGVVTFIMSLIMKRRGGMMPHVEAIGLFAVLLGLFFSIII